MHSEPKAIFNGFSKHGYTPSMEDYAMIVTHGPCDQCLKYMAWFNIKLVIYDHEYKTEYDKWSEQIFVYKRDRWLDAIEKREVGQ